MSSTDRTAAVTRPEARDKPSSAEQMALAVAAARDRKAEDLRVLDVGSVSDFTDQFLLCSGTNDRQVKAISDLVLERLRENGIRPLHVEGYDHGTWVLMDFGGDMVVHVFLDNIRAFYGLERLWSDAPDITDHFPDGDGPEAHGPDERSST